MQHESYVARQDEFVARQKLSSYLVFQLVTRHHLKACDKVRLIRVLRQNCIPSYFEYSSNIIFNTFTLKVYYNISYNLGYLK